MELNYKNIKDEIKINIKIINDEKLILNKFNNNNDKLLLPLIKDILKNDNYILNLITDKLDNNI